MFIYILCCFYFLSRFTQIIIALEHVQMFHVSILHLELIGTTFVRWMVFVLQFFATSPLALDKHLLLYNVGLTEVLISHLNSGTIIDLDSGFRPENSGLVYILSSCVLRVVLLVPLYCMYRS